MTKITKKPLNDRVKTKEKQKEQPSLDTTKSVSLPAEILYQLAEAGGVGSHDVMSALNSSFHKLLQQPTSIRRALVQDGVHSRALPDVSQIGAQERLARLRGAERFLSNRASFAFPPGSVWNIEMAHGSLFAQIACEEAGAENQANEVKTTLHLFSWSATPPKWVEVPGPQGAKTATFSTDGEHLAVGVASKAGDHFLLYNVRSEPKLVFTHTTTGSDEIISENFCFLEDAGLVMFSSKNEHGESITHFVSIQEPHTVSSMRLDYHDLYPVHSFSSGRDGLFIRWSDDAPLLVDVTPPQRSTPLSQTLAGAQAADRLYVDRSKDALVALDGDRVLVVPLSAPNSAPSVTPLPGTALQYSEGSIACSVIDKSGVAGIQLFDLDGRATSGVMELGNEAECEQLVLQGRRAIVLQSIREESEPNEEEGSELIYTMQQHAVLFSDQSVKQVEISDEQYETAVVTRREFIRHNKDSWIFSDEGEIPRPFGSQQPFRQQIRALSLEDLEHHDLSVELGPDDIRAIGMDPGAKRVLLATSEKIHVLPLK